MTFAQRDMARAGSSDLATDAQCDLLDFTAASKETGSLRFQ